MSETQGVILRVRLADDKKSLVVSVGTNNEALLALALRKAQIAVDEALVVNEMKREAENKSDLVIPETVLTKLG